MKSKYFFSLDSIKPKNESGGSYIHITSDETPGFTNIALSSLKVKSGGSVEPIWHPNASKIGVCLQGSANISIRSPTTNNVFIVNEGDEFFIPKGYVYSVENRGDKDNHIVFAFNNAQPQIMRLSKAIYSLSDSVLGITFQTPVSFYEGLKKAQPQKDELIKNQHLKALKSNGSNSNNFKFNLAGSKKNILTKGGYLKIGTKSNFPVLEGLGILAFGLTPKGIVEPHWHTNAGELVYVHKGKVRMTVLSPDGTVDIVDAGPGEGAFAPASHFHNIENLGVEDAEIIAFFNHELPDFIGIAEVVGSYSNELLGSVFNLEPKYFEAMKKTNDPLVILP